MSSEDLRLSVNQTVAGRYRVAGVLGAGDMGEVYDVRDTAKGEAFALKLLSSEATQQNQAWAAYQREAKAAAALGLDTIVRCHDFGVERSVAAPYVVGEYVSIPSIADLVSLRGPLPMSALESFFAVLGTAMDQAHAHGLIHRGLKPRNVFAKQRKPNEWDLRISDFGLANLRAVIPPPPGWVGTVGWIPSEQADPNARPERTMDIYALGLLAFYMLTGKSPFLALRQDVALPQPAPVDVKKLWGEMTSPIPPASQRARELRATINSTLDPWFDRALALEPRDRFQSVGEMAQAFASPARVSRPTKKSQPPASHRAPPGAALRPSAPGSSGAGLARDSATARPAPSDRGGPSNEAHRDLTRPSSTPTTVLSRSSDGAPKDVFFPPVAAPNASDDSARHAPTVPALGYMAKPDVPLVAPPRPSLEDGPSEVSVASVAEDSARQIIEDAAVPSRGVDDPAAALDSDPQAALPAIARPPMLRIEKWMLALGAVMLVAVLGAGVLCGMRERSKGKAKARALVPSAAPAVVAAREPDDSPGGSEPPDASPNDDPQAASSASAMAVDDSLPDAGTPTKGAAKRPGYGHVKFKCAPACEDIVCDGKKVGTASDGVWLLPGRHNCVGVKKGSVTRPQHFVLKAGDEAIKGFVFYQAGGRKNSLTRHGKK